MRTSIAMKVTVSSQERSSLLAIKRTTNHATLTTTTRATVNLANVDRLSESRPSAVQTAIIQMRSIGEKRLVNDAVLVAVVTRL
tara:strand:+ start:169 stop:420 length:252 start_codon:yes stop_codon:yes gene_type:complete